MGFQETKSDISICNKALSRIKQQELSGSLTDPANLNKHAARECARWYKTVVRQLLSEHHWGLATKRVALAGLANDRDSEWTNAYAPPSDMAFPVMVGPYASGIGVSYYKGLGFILASLYGRPIFRFEGGTIYSIVDGATLDYVSFNITEQDFNEALESLIVMFLSSELARSVAKDDKLADDLYNQAVRKMNLVIAQSFNVNQPRYDNVISDTELARGGLDPQIANLYGLPR